MTSVSVSGTATAATDAAMNQYAPLRTVAGVSVPDTPLVARAIEYAREHSEPYLFNHVMRSWLFAATLAHVRKVPHDAEVLAVAAVLHDLGLAKAFNGPLRFEVEGANAARALAREEGADERRAQLIWDGVALHSTPSISLHKETEVALCTAGIGVDWGGWGYETVPASTMTAILAAFPRMQMKERFTRAVCDVVKTRPNTTYDNFARDFGEREPDRLRVNSNRRPDMFDETNRAARRSFLTRVVGTTAATALSWTHSGMAATAASPYADPKNPALPASGMRLDLRRTALVVIDPQIDFMSPKGASWSIVGESVTEQNLVPNLVRLFGGAADPRGPAAEVADTAVGKAVSRRRQT